MNFSEQSNNLFSEGITEVKNITPTPSLMNDTDEPPFKYTFIHITKSGGSAVEIYFKKHYSKFIMGETHSYKAEKNNHPIVIVREPIERFISSYHYWKNGSYDRNKRPQNFQAKYSNCSIKDYIHLIKHNIRTELVNGFTWREHLYKQDDWLNPAFYANSIVIIYEPNLQNKIYQLLDYINVENKMISLPRYNITRCKEGENVILEKDDLLWIREHFKEDFDLWDKLHFQQECFLKVI